MEWALIWLVCPFAAGAIAARHEATLTGFLLGLLFGPLGVLLALLADNRKKCPHCKSGIAKGATVCAACHSSVAWIKGQPQAVAARDHGGFVG